MVVFLSTEVKRFLMWKKPRDLLQNVVPYFLLAIYFLQGNLPLRYEDLGPLYLKKAEFYPRSNGARAYSSQWRRNRYTFSGNYFYVYVRLKPGKNRF